jgi:hypothetical protein
MTIKPVAFLPYRWELFYNLPWTTLSPRIKASRHISHSGTARALALLGLSAFSLVAWLAAAWMFLMLL